jgi:hypothetical protein
VVEGGEDQAKLTNLRDSCGLERLTDLSHTHAGTGGGGMQWILPGWEEDVEIKIESRGSRNAQMTLTNRRETICFLLICNSSYMSLGEPLN